MNNQKELEFIKEFNQIQISTICDDLKIDRSNIYKRGTYCDIIKKEIDKKILNLYKNYLEKEDKIYG